jgi:hypothetical protein
MILSLGTIERLKVLSADGGSLTDNVAEVRQLCISVEEILRHQQKGEGGGGGGGGGGGVKGREREGRRDDR